jgi:hypothetical protein
MHLPESAGIFLKKSCLTCLPAGRECLFSSKLSTGCRRERESFKKKKERSSYFFRKIPAER